MDGRCVGGGLGISLAVVLLFAGPWCGVCMLGRVRSNPSG